jgi:hypothetical protein
MKLLFNFSWGSSDKLIDYSTNNFKTNMQNFNFGMKWTNNWNFGMKWINNWNFGKPNPITCFVL